MEVMSGKSEGHLKENFRIQGKKSYYKAIASPHTKLNLNPHAHFERVYIMLQQL
jgi:hypothetical protein